MTDIHTDRHYKMTCNDNGNQTKLSVKNFSPPKNNTLHSVRYNDKNLYLYCSNPKIDGLTKKKHITRKS